MNEYAVQWSIMILSGAAAWFVTQKVQRARLVGCVLGLASQPFWIYTTFEHQQWGMLVLAGWYTWMWGKGIYNNWLRRVI